MPSRSPIASYDAPASFSDIASMRRASRISLDADADLSTAPSAASEISEGRSDRFAIRQSLQVAVAQSRKRLGLHGEGVEARWAHHVGRVRGGRVDLPDLAHPLHGLVDLLGRDVVRPVER